MKTIRQIGSKCESRVWNAVKQKKVPFQNMRNKKRRKEVYKYHQTHICVLLWPFARKISWNLFRIWLLRWEQWVHIRVFWSFSVLDKVTELSEHLPLTRKWAAWPHGAAVCFRCMKSTKRLIENIKQTSYCNYYHKLCWNQLILDKEAAHITLG